MPTTGIIDGGYIFVEVDDVVVECLTDCSMNMTAEEVDVTCKNTSGDKSFEVGAKETTFDFTAQYQESGSNTRFSTLFGLFDNRSTAVIKYGSQQTGDLHYTATCILPTLTHTAGNTGSKATISGTFKAQGAVTEVTNP